MPTRADARDAGATVLGYCVKAPERYGVAELGEVAKGVGGGEGTAQRGSHNAVSGLWLKDGRASDDWGELDPSPRGELEITDAIQWLVERG